MWQKFKVFNIIVFFLLVGRSYGQLGDPLIVKGEENQQQYWVDSLYNTLNLKQKVGQLFMVDVFSSGSKEDFAEVQRLIKDFYIGGVIFSKGGPGRQAHLTNQFQQNSKIPLMIGMDAEWGLAMRLDSVQPFPWNMTLGAIQDIELIKQTGKHIARNCKRLGVHINFAPVVDINTNPNNPIIGNRSFGEDKESVTERSLAFLQGMQSEGILASAKHFPGHGDTDQDSHKTLPSITFDKDRIEEIELFPYKQLFKSGLESVMTAHLNIPSLESRPGYPSSASDKIVTDILKKQLDFKGLIITDALNMKGASDFKNPGELDLAAFLAGNDILLISEDVPLASQKIVSAYYAGQITEERLSASVKKILKAKYKAGLHRYTPVSLFNLDNDLNSAEDAALRDNLYEASLTLVKNYKSVLPVKNLNLKKIAYVSFGEGNGNPFFEELNKYAAVDWVKSGQLNDLIRKLRAYNYVIIGHHSSNSSPWTNYKLNEKELEWVQEIAKLNTTIFTLFSSPYALLDFKSFKKFEGVLVSYQNSATAQEKSAQLLFGAISAKGKLPVSVQKEFKNKHGLETRTMNRLSYGIPENVGMSSIGLKRIDSVVYKVLNEKMTPGLQLLVARKGKVVFNKSYGFHTYDKKQPVQNTDIYDLASLTKILSTLPLVMELVDQGVIDLKTRVGELLPSFKGSNKEHITVRSMLSHYARFKAWIPFYLKTMDSLTAKPDKKYYRNKLTKEFNVEITNNLYLREDIKDSLMLQIKESELRKRLQYKYSDLPYYILKAFIENHYDASLSELTANHFYQSLGANRMGYLPLQRFSKKQIIPSEDDVAFRNQIVHGYVHDQGAAMMGGVGGHAGLFSNANDVAKMMQMYLNGGTYGGKRYLKKETLASFNSCNYCYKKVRRGVGFDKPQLGEVGPTCGCVSKESFGHSGFTGTFTWADPDEEIVYVFLSNRTFPDAANRKLIVNDIRSEIQRIIYEAIER